MRQIYDIIISSKNCLSLGAFDGDTMIGFAEATLWDDSGMVKAINTVCLDNIFVPDAIAMYEAMGMTPQRYVFEKKL